MSPGLDRGQNAKDLCAERRNVEAMQWWLSLLETIVAVQSRGGEGILLVLGEEVWAGKRWRRKSGNRRRVGRGLGNG